MRLESGDMYDYVNKYDIMTVTEIMGLDVLNDDKKLSALFEPKFEMSLRSMAAMYNYDDALEDSRVFKEKLNDIIGSDLNGFRLEIISISLEGKS